MSRLLRSEAQLFLINAERRDGLQSCERWASLYGPLNWLWEARLSAPARFMKPYPKYLDWLRYLSAYLLFTYGVSKLAGWQFSLSPDIAAKPIGALSGFQLTWYYYSYSHIYARILGTTQLVGGALLLSRKTALLGAAAMLPMIANILLSTCSFTSQWGRSVRRRSSSYPCWRCCGENDERLLICSGAVNPQKRIALADSTARWLR